ncbi:MAG TPA: helix-turn-helix domain-containing protein [Terracidiphilus sp.]
MNLQQLNESNSVGLIVVNDENTKCLHTPTPSLEVSGWNRRHAAQYLNISYRGLLYKIKEHRITPRTHGSLNGSI